MWRLKGCPRCGGDLEREWEQNGYPFGYQELYCCLQCGYRDYTGGDHGRSRVFNTQGKRRLLGYSDSRGKDMSGLSNISRRVRV